MLFAGMAALDKMSPRTGKQETSNFKKRRNEAGMLFKTKDRCGKSRNEAGMLLIIKDIKEISGNVVENKRLIL